MILSTRKIHVVTILSSKYDSTRIPRFESATDHLRKVLCKLILQEYGDIIITTFGKNIIKIKGEKNLAQYNLRLKIATEIINGVQIIVVSNRVLDMVYEMQQVLQIPPEVLIACADIIDAESVSLSLHRFDGDTLVWIG